jgi:hypothetical protein
MSKPPSKRRRVELTFQDKINLIKESESFPKPSQKSLSEKFGVGKTTVSDILKRKPEYLANFESNENVQKFRFAERKRLFTEPPKTGTSENRLISLAPDVVGFQRFHCILFPKFTLLILKFQ